MQEVKFNPIGIVRSDTSDEEIKNRVQGRESTVEVYPAFENALEGLKGFSHVFVISYFNKLRPEQIGPLKVKPRSLLRSGVRPEDLPTLGVFALDSPTRPNPVGLSLVRLLRIEEKRNLIVSDLDLFDRTPVLDIKPYQDSYKAKDSSLPGWHVELLKKAGHV